MPDLKRYIGLILFIVCGGFFSCLQAQTLTATASQTTVQAGQGFQVEYSVNGNASAFTPPAFNGFTVVGNIRGFNSNGITSNMTFTFALVAGSEGTFTIPPASAQCNGKTLTSNSLTIKVVKGAVPQNPPPAQTGNNQQPAAASTNNKNFFIRVVPAKSKAYVGEGVTVILKIYYRQEYTNGQITEFPDYNGFYTEDIPQTPKNQTTIRETVNGLTYYVDEIPQKVIFPQHAGKITVGAYTGTFLIEQAVKRATMFGYMVDYERIPYNVKTEPFSIDVMPLPQTGKQTSGAVGDFTLKGEIDKNKVKANDAINLTITISGSGNLKLIDTLPVRIPPDFDRYDPKITDHFTVSSSGMAGTRTYNYLLVPRHQGSYKIAPIEFTYFNPKTKGYVTLSTSEMDIDVAPGDNNSSSVTMTGTANKEDVKMLGSDIRYIHGGHESFYRTDNFFLYSFPFFLGIFLPILLFIGFVIGRNRYIEMNRDALAVKKRRATSMAKKRLKIAQESIAAGNKEVFYAELLNALNGYFSDKFSIALADLSRDSITANLAQKNAKPETIALVNKTLDDCEFVRYAPAAVTANLEEVYTSAVKLITLLEDEIS